MTFAREVGFEVALGLVFSISPKHTDEYYAQKVQDAAALQVDTIYVKDSGGLLTPDRVRTLIPAFLEKQQGDTRGTPLTLHDGIGPIGLP